MGTCFRKHLAVFDTSVIFLGNFFPRRRDGMELEEKWMENPSLGKMGHGIDARADGFRRHHVSDSCLRCSASITRGLVSNHGFVLLIVGTIDDAVRKSDQLLALSGFLLNLLCRISILHVK